MCYCAYADHAHNTIFAERKNQFQKLHQNFKNSFFPPVPKASSQVGFDGVKTPEVENLTLGHL
jgi:hypothetical protein